MAENIILYHSQLDAIGVRASTPFERQQLEYESDQHTSEQELQSRLQQLSQVLGASDSQHIERFLAQHHFDQQRIRHLLSPSHFTPSSIRPDWIKKLEQILTDCDSNTANALSLDRSQLSQDPIPFEELLFPFIYFARTQLSLRCLSQVSLLSDLAHISLERWLLQSLSRLAAPALQLEFSLFRSQYSLLRTSPGNGQQRLLYTAFVARYHGLGLIPFLLEYSLLARLLMLRIEQWIEACVEFLSRLVADLDEIIGLFFQCQSPGTVVAVQPNCSDPHHNGRTVFLVTFASGLKVVYKPRCMDIDQAFFDLLSWCNMHGLSPALKILRVLSRSIYGWMEYVEHLPCMTLQQVQNYYQRAGMLACLLYVLGGTDMHDENLVACGEHPVLIDLETVVDTGLAFFALGQQASSNSPRPGDFFDRSVCRSGLLPEWTSLGGGSPEVADISALGSIESYQPHLQPIWKNINTDTMCLQQEKGTGVDGEKHNVVMLNETVVKPWDSTRDVIAGFVQLYRLFLDHRHELLALNGPLASFEHCPLRFIQRDTDDYMMILKHLSRSKFLRDATDRWIELQRLKQPLLTEEQTDPRLWEIVDAEIAALERLDVPTFMTTSDSLHLQTDQGQLIKNVFSASPLEQVRLCLARLSEADLQQQSSLIVFAILALEPVSEEEMPVSAQHLASRAPLSPTDLITVACEIGHELCSRVYRDARGGVSWISFHDTSQVSDPKRYRLGPVSFDLYDGIGGISLFLAALASFTGESEYQTLVISALQPLCQKVHDMASSPSGRDAKRGLVSDLGSVVYALSQISTWLQRPELLDTAKQAARLITEQCIHADQDFDVITGCAGTILGLLALYKQAAEEEVLQRAIMCGQYLLEKRQETSCGARSWSAFQERPLTGFSHGAAGIAYALLRLAAVTGEQAFKDAAQEAIRFEQDLFSPEAGNWPDLRKKASAVEMEGPSTFMTSWCHGAPGIGLGRLGGLDILDTPSIRQDIQVALQTTQAAGLTDVDNLCCGNFGRLDLFVTASQRLNQPHLLQVARQWAGVLVHHARQGGGFYFLRQLPRRAYHPSLFTGSAGIGYECLRLAFPEQFPSVLLWE
jgi:type 2 lantibiotic biosynthesis protein LanM